MTSISVSIRRGKLAPTTRRKPKGAFGAYDTNWRVGIDAPSYSTTYDDSCNRATELTFEPRRRVEANKSDKVFRGSYRAPPGEPRLTTVARMELTRTVHTPGYHLQRPKEGFDRLTANRTNYSLGEHARDFTTSTTDLQTRDPRERPRAEQASIGGYTLSDGSYRLDAPARESVRRGGGGGEGALGVRFNIINGEEDLEARGKVVMRSGPRVTLNSTEKEVLHPTNAWGDMVGECYIDAITGLQRKTPKAPGGGALRAPARPNTILGRTRPW